MCPPPPVLCHGFNSSKRDVLLYTVRVRHTDRHTVGHSSTQLMLIHSVTVELVVNFVRLTLVYKLTHEKTIINIKLNIPNFDSLSFNYTCSVIAMVEKEQDTRALPLRL